MLAEGHEIANHGYSHADLRRLKPEAQFLEMKKTQDVLHALGAEVRYFRPPYGRYTPQTTAKAEALGMTIMLWSLDSQDWKRHVSRLEGLRSISPVVQRSFPGMRGVLLFHDTHKHTVDEMADILDALTVGGCERFVTVSEYMAKAPREEEHRLATQAPNEGRGETPPPSLAEQQHLLPAGGIAPQPANDARNPRMPELNMRTQAAHPVQDRMQDMAPSRMRTQTTHGSPAPPALPEVLMVGIEVNGQTAPAVRQAQTRTPAPLSLVRAVPPTTPKPRASAALQGQIPQLLSSPVMILPAHRPSKDTRDVKRGANGPG
jgi:hypothetical protein